jgi:hypothetical protein
MHPSLMSTILLLFKPMKSVLVSVKKISVTVRIARKNEKINIMNKKARFFFVLGRIFLVLAFLALIVAWTCSMTAGMMFGMGEQHFFSNAIVLALLGIGFLFVGFIYTKTRGP